MSSPPPQSLAEDTLTKLRRLKQLQAQQAAREADARPRYQWLCDWPDCDGKPHLGWSHKHARSTQHPPADPHVGIWLLKCGRGWGKTRTAAEAFAARVLAHPLDEDGVRTEWLVAGETFADTRQICVSGKSGLLRALSMRGARYRYDKSKWEITVLNQDGSDGQLVYIQGGDDPDCGRGFNLSGAWIDEAAKWTHFEEAWSEGIGFAVRITTADGSAPFVIVSTTPKPKRWIRDWIHTDDGTIVVTHGSTFENADNLSPVQLAKWKAKHAGTRRGRQELDGEYLEDVEGALWTRADIDAQRRDWMTFEQMVDAGLITRVVVGVDPAATSGEEADYTGIVAAGVDRRGEFWVMADRSKRATPNDWATTVIDLYDEQRADRVVAEVNNGGDMVVSTMKTLRANLPVTKVTATRGKQLRAEPISALYEQGRVHHVGDLGLLEDQMVSWTPEDPGSPDRMDALVWALTHLSVASGAKNYLEALVAEQETAEDRPVSLPGVNTSDYFRQLVG